MYSAAALDPLNEKHATAKCDHCGGTGKHGDQDCKKCGGDGWIDAKDVVKEAPGNSLDDWNAKMNKDDDPSDQYNTEYQVDPELDDAADGSLIGWINKQTETNPEFVQKFIQFIQDTEGINPDDTGRIPHDRGYIPGQHD
jgi:hypothetical protein